MQPRKDCCSFLAYESSDAGPHPCLSGDQRPLRHHTVCEPDPLTPRLTCQADELHAECLSPSSNCVDHLLLYGSECPFNHHLMRERDQLESLQALTHEILHSPGGGRGRRPKRQTLPRGEALVPCRQTRCQKQHLRDHARSGDQCSSPEPPPSHGTPLDSRTTQRDHTNFSGGDYPRP